MYEYFELNIDEVENAINSIDNMLLLKRIEEELYKEEGFEYMYSLYRNFPSRRDYDYEGYNGIHESSLGILFLDAIFRDDYEIKDYDVDEGYDVYEELYYNFGIDKDSRLYTEDEFYDICQTYSVLKLRSSAIQKALEIASGNKTILNNILRQASYVKLSHGDLEESSTVNLSDNSIEILLGSWSMYEIELSAVALLNLEKYCREVVELNE